MQMNLIFVVLCFSVCACKRNVDRFDPYVIDEKELCSRSLAGVWMVDEASINMIKEKLGYRKYINQTDHVLCLNENGSCVYTGFSLYIDNGVLISEYDYLNNMRNYYNSPDPKSTDKYCWYESIKSFPFVLGPYLCTNELPNVHAHVFEKTFWSRWQVCKRTKKICVEDYTQPHDWNFKIELCAVGLKNIDGSNANLYFARDKRGIYLFVPIVTDDGPMVDSVKFRKIEAEQGGKGVGTNGQRKEDGMMP